MANFTPSELVKGQAIFNQKYKSGEWRIPDTATLSVAYQGEKTTPLLKELRKKESRTVSAYLPIRKTKSSATERVYNHSGTSGDSLEVPVTWQTSIDTFSISVKQNDNNIISFEENWASQMQSSIYNILTDAENKLIASILADRTQINVGGVFGEFDTTDYIVKNPLSDEDYFFEQIKANMVQNLFKGQIIVVADSIAAITAARIANQGANNATNLGWQLNNMKVVQTTNSLFSGYRGSALAFPMEMCGTVPWIPKQNRKPLDPVKAMSVLGDYGSIDVPVYDDKGNVIYTLQVAIHMYAERADTSGRNGSKQDDLIQVELSLDTAYISAPLSDFRATGEFAGKSDSVIYAYGQLAS